MRRLALVFVLATAVWILPAASPPAAVTTPTAATGVTGIALDGRVELAWQPVAGASGYTVYRGTTATSINTLLTGAGGVAGTTFTDNTASNNTTYYYAVRSVAGGVESANSNTVAAAPVARACSTGNAVVLENCLPGEFGLGRPQHGHCAERRNRGLRHRGEHQQGPVGRPEGQQRRQLDVPDRDLPQRLLRRRRCAALLDHPRRPGRAAARLSDGLDDRADRLLELGRLRDAHDDRKLAFGHLPAANHARGHRQRQPDPARRPRRLEPLGAALRHRVLELRGLQQLRRQVALRLQLVRWHDGRGNRPSREGLARPPVRAASLRPARLVHAHRVRDGLLARAVRLSGQLRLEHRPRAQRGASAEPPRLHLVRPRRVLLGGHAQRARECARGRREPLLQRLERGLLEDSLRGQPEHGWHRSGGGLLQVDAERAARPERHSHGHLARSRRREQPRERAQRRDVRRRQRQRLLPVHRQRGPGHGPPLPLHGPLRAAARRLDHVRVDP